MADDRRRLKAMTAEFNEHEKLYEEQRRRHIAQQQRVKKEERKAAAEAQQLELYVHPTSSSLSLSSFCHSVAVPITSAVASIKLVVVKPN